MARRRRTEDAGGGFGSSAAEGREVPANIEDLPLNQRLNAEGRLETVTIEPTDEGQETALRPVLKLGTDDSLTSSRRRATGAWRWDALI